jgi:hypothetical protein
MPDPSADFAAACARACPTFRATSSPWRAFKTELVFGEVDGAPVIAKRLLRATAVWAWYFARERAVYAALAAAPVPVRAPQLVAADDRVLIVERLPGAPLAKRRYPRADLAPATVRALALLCGKLATWTGEVRAQQPPPRVRSQLRSRLLEDPSAPLQWIRDGVARCASREVIGGALARRIDAALAAHAPIAFGHGDFLLRNVLHDDATGALALVDWECAGTHVRDWDLALLWAQLGDAARATLEAMIDGEPRRRAFHALAAFAIARELRYVNNFGAARPGEVERLRAELAGVAARVSSD